MIKSLPSQSSPGPDGIPPILLKEGGTGLLLAIHDLFSFIICRGVLPKEWKMAIVVPIFKKGNRSECKNYRPISLTCSLCKVFERLLKDHMLQFLLDNDLLNASQHGFLPKRSCLTALLTFLEEVTISVDNKVPIDIVLLDFSKAFDSVPHNKLILKLKNIGFNGVIISLIESFLADRCQKVTVSNSFSDYLPITSGVPQGSVLGPLLFIIYINDLDDNISSNVIKFADDVKIFAPCDGRSSHHFPRPPSLQDDLNIISKWCHNWCLNLNFSKCFCLHVGSNNPRSSYNIDDHPLFDVSSIVDLGITFTEDLKPSAQCLKVAAKAQRMISVIKLSFKYLDVNTLTLLYKALVRPILEYCGVVWCPYLIKDIDILENVQRRFTRFLPSLRDLPYNARLSHLNLDTLYARRLRFDLITVYKVFHGLIKINPSSLFHLSTDFRTRGHNYKLFVSHSRLDIRKYFFSCRVIPMWNALPVSCVQASSVPLFKTRLSNFLQSIDVR